MNPYRHADKALKTLKADMEGSFQNFSMTVGFDELNYTDLRKSVNGLYTQIDTMVRRELRKVARQVYRDAEDEIGIPHREFATGLFLIGILKDYNKVTKYVYLNEWTRKRDRLVESLMASDGNQEMRQALQRALNLMSDQVRQYADNVTDEARRDAFVTAGIEKVRWVAEKDDKTCATCKERDGQVYGINEVPEKHRHCRCYIVAVSMN